MYNYICSATRIVYKVAIIFQVSNFQKMKKSHQGFYPTAADGKTDTQQVKGTVDFFIVWRRYLQKSE